LELSQLDTPEGESYRLLWDRQKGGTADARGKNPPQSPEAKTAIVEKTKLILHFKQAPGDTLVASGAIECLHSQYPEEYATDVLGSGADAIFENSPHRSFNHGQGQEIVMDNPLINQADKAPLHFLKQLLPSISYSLGKPITLTVNRPSLYLSDQEKGWLNQVEEETGCRGKYWLISAEQNQTTRLRAGLG